MISAYAKAYQVLADEKYLKAGERAANFIRTNLYNADKKTLIRNYREGTSNIHGFCEDYAFLIAGLLDLYEASLNVSWLGWALTLQQKQDELFLAKDGGYYNVIEGDKSLLFRVKEDYDGAEPSYNSVAAMNLLRLHAMLHIEKFRDQARGTILAFRDRLLKAPIALPEMTVAALFYLHPFSQIVIAGDPSKSDTKELIRLTNSKFIPNKVLLLADGKDGQKFLSEHSSFFKDITLKGKATGYICQNFTCNLPTDDPKVFEVTLEEINNKNKNKQQQQK